MTAHKSFTAVSRSVSVECVMQTWKAKNIRWSSCHHRYWLLSKPITTIKDYSSSALCRTWHPRLWRDDCMFLAALFHLIWSQRQDLHDDVQTVAECAAGQGEQTWSAGSVSTAAVDVKVNTGSVVKKNISFLTLTGQQPLCPKELWHFVHQCYGNELGLTSDDEDYVPPDDDFNTMGWVSPHGYNYEHLLADELIN